MAFEALCCPLVATGHVASFIPGADVLDGFPTRRGAPEGRPRLSWTPYMAGAGQMLGGPGPEERAARTETPPFPHPLSVDARGSPHDRCPVTVGCVREGRKVAADSVGFSAWMVGCHGLEHSCLTQERGDWQGPRASRVLCRCFTTLWRRTPGLWARNSGPLGSRGAEWPPA